MRIKSSNWIRAVVPEVSDGYVVQRAKDTIPTLRITQLERIHNLDHWPRAVN
jgi:hypothetical protein